MRRLFAVAALVAIVVLAGCGTTVPLQTQQYVYGGSNQSIAPTTQGDGLGSLPTATVPPTGDVTPSQPLDNTGPAPTAPSASAASNTAAPHRGGKGSSTPSASPTHSAVNIPTTGRGWDAHNVYIGVMTANDFSTAAAALGAKDADPGNQEEDAQTVADLINSQGGLFGRKVVPVYDNVSTASLLIDAAGDASQACTHFTQDRPVIAVYNDLSPIDLPSFRSCFAQAKLPLYEGSIQSISRSALNGDLGYVTSVVSPTYSDLAPTFVARLQAEHYFTGWNVTNGTAGSAPVKVGIIADNVPADQEAAEALSAALARDGHPPVAQFNYTIGASGTTSNLSSAVLQFRSRGITHVIGADAGTGTFMVQAQSQHFYPRYGINTINLPASSLTPDAPKEELQGALGIGWYPTLDVNGAQDPGYLSAAGKTCLAALLKGQSYATRFAFGIGTSFCDSFGLIRAAVIAGGGFTGPQVVRGEALAGPTYTPAGSFGSNLHSGDWAIPGAGRDLGWIGKCQCFEYLSKTDYPFGS
ncbi:MAG TPA: hypothetical protein VHW74_09360 [Mycobacteriales bacterium]|jgi:hypothetical protein|nr:hypothetical protein [Mycobacteriales bacterium]